MTEAQWLASEDPAAMLAWLNVPVPPNVRRQRVEGHTPSARKLRLFVEAVTGITTWVDMGTDFNWAGLAVDVVGAEHARHHPPPAAQAALLREIVGNPFRPVVLPKGRARCPECINERWHGWHGSDSLADAFAIELAERCCKTCNPVWDRPSEAAGWVDGPCPWLTPQVISLAQAAYEGRVELSEEQGYEAIPTSIGTTNHRCLICGYVATGRLRANHRKFCTRQDHLDNARLAVLSDAMEEAGCPAEECRQCHKGQSIVSAFTACWRCGGNGLSLDSILGHLRSPDLHVRGCWALDLILGKT